LSFVLFVCKADSKSFGETSATATR